MTTSYHYMVSEETGNVWGFSLTLCASLGILLLPLKMQGFLEIACENFEVVQESNMAA